MTLQVSPDASVRAADPDDAGRLIFYYRSSRMYSALLDQRREPVMATRDELAEMLAGKDRLGGQLFALMDCSGSVIGFGGLRGASLENLTGEVFLLLRDDSDYAASSARGMLAFLLDRAFGRMHLNKVLAVGLVEEEEGWRTLLRETGFHSCGVQRQIVYARGRWFDLETFTLKQETWLNAVQHGPLPAAG
ncbi:MAG TPA: GNAT family N-acetyltransferase [Candidatus Hydrogenedentes bacterium]|nr:GNAT family N-acetyltransferase [Candidatus Hydrogenedentota bacterium]HPU96739.1 GNAT family N-acetyltransferase [Candidatus Hydrogenedentota bacterium]